MSKSRTLLFALLAAALGGCAAAPAPVANPGFGSYFAGVMCPAGAVMVCAPDSLEPCRCGTLILR